VPIQRIDLNDQAYETIKSRLLSREFGPQAKLSLQTLADELEVSRSPIHHALTRLVTEGLVEVDRRGYWVRPLTADLMSETHDVRCAIELFAADRTVGLLSPEQLETMHELVQETVDLVSDEEFVDKYAFMLANKAFHEYIVDLAGNATLSETYRSLSLHQLMERALAGSTTEAGNSNDEHRRILHAYEAGDLVAARAAIVANVETGKRLALAVIDASGGVL
jgi:DNA-binding GntR family transcriptional regulator